MGRIKSTLIKRTAKKLVEKSPEMFTKEFKHNEKVLGRTMPSKPIRNKIAGYISRIIRMKSEVKKPKVVQIEDPERRERREYSY